MVPEARPPGDARRPRVAVLYVCTGEYVRFWAGAYGSFQKRFLKDCAVEYVVFTDATTLEPLGENVRIIPTPQEEWPFPTLFRYRTFVAVAPILEEFDYLYFINANIVCAGDVTREAILPREELGEELVFVTHPGFWDKPTAATYERNPRSRAFVSPDEAGVYVCGGVNGGTSAAFMRMARALADDIEADWKNGVVATWHDESHLNRFVLDADNYRLLEPAYCYPEHWDGPFARVLMLRDKSGVIDEGAIKGWNKGHMRFLPPWLRGIGRRAVHLIRLRTTVLPDVSVAAPRLPNRPSRGGRV